MNQSFYLDFKKMFQREHVIWYQYVDQFLSQLLICITRIQIINHIEMEIQKAMLIVL